MTDRLSATDASFLYAEDAGIPMHVGGVVILEPHADGPEIAYAEIMNLIESRLGLVPRYRQKVRFVPGRLARPVWVDDEDFDLTYHVRRSALPRPGTDAELNELVGRLISRPLDRSRPLWEVYVIEGLTGGRVTCLISRGYPTRRPATSTSWSTPSPTSPPAPPRPGTSPGSPPRTSAR